MAYIGIKTADGGFYRVCEDERVSRKRVKLVPARDDQTSVQIDLFRGDAEKVEGAEYIGSLLLEYIEATADGTRSLELVLHLDEQRDLQATVNDLGSGSYQSFSVNLDALSESGGFDMPDFSLDEDQIDEVEVTGVSDEFDEMDLGDENSDDSFERELEQGLDEESDFGSEAKLPEPPRFDIEDEIPDYSDSDDSEGKFREIRKLHPVLLVGIILIVLAAMGLITFGVVLLLRNSQASALQSVLPTLIAWSAAIG